MENEKGLSLDEVLSGFAARIQLMEAGVASLAAHICSTPKMREEFETNLARVKAAIEKKSGHVVPNDLLSSLKGTPRY